MKKVLCVIPARGKSKRVPGKNIRKVLGKPMVAYTIEKALESELCGKVVVSTDGADIAAVARKFGAEVIKRPDDISADVSPIDDAIRHAAVQYASKHGFDADIIVSLQANVPVRKKDEIDLAIRTLAENPEVTAVATAYKIDQRPEWMKIVDERTGLAKPFMPPTENFRAQSLPDRYLLDGAIIAVRKDVLMAAAGVRTVHAYLGERVKLLVHDRKYAVEIDEEDDLDTAEYYLGKEARGPLEKIDIKMRKARPGDSKDLWEWRNDPDTRKWSYNTGKIEYPDHRAWFSKKLKEKGARIYIAENGKKEKIGQIRFELAGKGVSSVNVNLNPVFFGRGLGSKVIDAGTRLFIKENPKVRTVTAEIKKENIASRKAFIKAGYRFSHGVKRAGANADVYKYGGAA